MLVTQHLARDLFKSKTVFVTGGGSGINLGVARNFAALGANVAICGRTQKKLDAPAEPSQSVDGLKSTLLCASILPLWLDA